MPRLPCRGLHFVLGLLVLITTTIAMPADLTEVKQGLAAHITSAQRSLSRIEAQISQERQQLARQLNSAQTRVLQFPEQ